MPYIVKNDREVLDPLIGGLATALRLKEKRAGIVNYSITSIIDKAYGEHTSLGYHDLNEIIGVLECVKQEFYRRVAAPYEDKKKELNGDVYPYTLAATREER